MRYRCGNHVLDDDPGRVDLDAVWGFLSELAYWGRWRTRDQVAAQIAASWRVVGAYDELGRLVGFARAVSDGVGTAYLADVFVVPDARGLGLGVDLVRVMIDEGPGADFRWTLHTLDAHELYRRFGFDVPPATAMERRSRRELSLADADADDMQATGPDDHEAADLAKRR